MFINGRPLPANIRMQIIQMAAQGTRPCAISRKLRVSHGCVSKILQRYAETGSIKPGSIGGSKPRLTTPVIEAKMDQYRLECPSILCYEIRKRLIDENVCDQQTAPSVSLIAKYLRKNESEEVAMAEKNSLSNSISEVSDEYSEECNRAEDNLLANKNLANVISLTHSRRLRTSFSQKQIDLLESVFNHTHYPDANLREDIGQTTGLSDNKIQIWFSNRRAKWRKNSTQQQSVASAASVQTEQPGQFQSPINYLTNHLTINNVYTTPADYQKQPKQPHQHNVMFNINNAAPPNLMQTSSPILNNQFVTNQVVKPLINYSTTVSNVNVSQEANAANLSGYQIDSSNPMTTPLFSSSSFNNNNNTNNNINDNSTLGINNNFLIESTSSPSSSSSSSPAANQYTKSNPYYYHQNNYGFYANNYNTNNYTKEVGILIII